MPKAYSMRTETIIQGDLDLLHAAARSIGRSWWAQRDRYEMTQDAVRVAIDYALSQPQLSALQNGIPVGRRVTNEGISAAFDVVGLTDDIEGVLEMKYFVMWWRDHGWG